MIPRFAMYFGSTEASTLFQEPDVDPKNFFSGEEEKHQEFEEGWLPIVITRWSRNEVSFERIDYAALHDSTEPLDGSKLMGNEPGLMISRLRMRNNSPVP